LDLHPDKPAQYVGLDYHGILEIPSIPTATDEIRNTVDELVSEVRQLPLKEIVTDLSDTLREIRNLIGSEDVRLSRRAASKTLQEVEDMMVKLNRSLGPLLDATHKAMIQAQSMMQESQGLVRDFHKETKPLLTATRQAVTTAELALGKAQNVLGTVEDTVGPESALQETLVSLRDAARSINDLTDYLERHPESLISGKD
jgi:paraquat-inducible protein B